MVASFLEYMQKEGETDERYRKKAISVGTKMHLWCAAAELSCALSYERCRP